MSEKKVWVVSNINEENLEPLSVGEVSRVDKLPETAPFAIILSKAEDQDWITLLASIRAKKDYRYTPIFYHGDVPPFLHHLFDGPADENVDKKSSVIYERMVGFGENVAQSDDKELMLLSYLYSREGIQMSGYLGLSPHIYEFPLLQVLFQNDPIEDGWQFLKDLVTRELLAQEGLLDEIQTCSACDSGLLNFKMSCPNCHSIDIKPQKFVHCFSCGKIAPIPEFLREERLICTRCKTKLSKLGVDYEKPKEDKLCNNCGHFFSEAEMELICLSCHKISPLQNMLARKLHYYTLTRRGEYLVRGIEKSIYKNFSHFFKVIDFDEFISITEWQIRLAERYSPVSFSVLTLQIINATEIVEEHGELNSERLIGQFFTCLRQIFRESDLSSRLDGTMYFLLPMTNQDGCLVVINRTTETVLQLASENIGVGLAVGISYMTSSEIIQEKLEGTLVPAELKTRMLESNLHVIKPKT